MVPPRIAGWEVQILTHPEELVSGVTPNRNPSHHHHSPLLKPLEWLAPTLISPQKSCYVSNKTFYVLSLIILTTNLGGG